MDILLLFLEYGWKKAPPWNLRKVRRGGSPGQNYFFVLSKTCFFFQIDVSLWRQNTKTMFLWQTDFIQFLAGGPPPWTWAKRFSLIPKKMKKTDNLQKFAIFFKLFSSWCHFLCFLINILWVVLPAIIIFWKDKLYFF